MGDAVESGVGRERLASRLGFLMLVAGCAVGLGNVWRFPFVVGKNGGAAFVVVYLLFLAVLGFPLLVAELSIGRGAGVGVTGALAKLAPKRLAGLWREIGRIVFFGNFLLMIYYTDVAGWLVKYTGGYLAGSSPTDGFDAAFASFVANRPSCAAYMLAVVVAATLTCCAGVVKGVERVTKVLMLSLLALLAVLVVKALALPGAAEGVSFYLKPDWAKFMEHPVSAVFDAMGQAFFTLSLGIGCMTIFGSYIGRGHSLVKESACIIAIDTAVALMAGLVIFPSCFTYGIEPSSGPGLIFVALPAVFAQMPGGRFWGFFFFLFLSMAALTTVVAVFECIIGGLVDETGRSRRLVAPAVGAAVAIASLPCVLVDAVLKWEDFAVSQLWLPIGALLQCLFVTLPIGWGWKRFREEASAGDGPCMPDALRWHATFAIPVLVLAVVAAGLWTTFR